MTPDPLHEIAERRIQEALEAGAFRDLPGAGRPLALPDLDGVPDELRAGYMLLRSAGILPEELELRRTVVKLGDLIDACRDEGELRALRAQRNAAALRLSILLERRGRGGAWSDYEARIADKLRG